MQPWSAADGETSDYICIFGLHNALLDGEIAKWLFSSSEESQDIVDTTATVTWLKEEFGILEKTPICFLGTTSMKNTDTAPHGVSSLFIMKLEQAASIGKRLERLSLSSKHLIIDNYNQ